MGLAACYTRFRQVPTERKADGINRGATRVGGLVSRYLQLTPRKTAIGSGNVIDCLVDHVSDHRLVSPLGDSQSSRQPAERCAYTVCYPSAVEHGVSPNA